MWVRQDLYVPDGQSIFTHEPFLIIASRKEWYRIQMEYIAGPVDYPIKLITPFTPIQGLRIRGYEMRLNRSDYGDGVWSRLKEWEERAVRCRVFP